MWLAYFFRVELGNPTMTLPRYLFCWFVFIIEFLSFWFQSNLIAICFWQSSTIQENKYSQWGSQSTAGNNYSQWGNQSTTGNKYSPWGNQSTTGNTYSQWGNNPLVRYDHIFSTVNQVLYYGDLKARFGLCSTYLYYSTL